VTGGASGDDDDDKCCLLPRFDDDVVADDETEITGQIDICRILHGRTGEAAYALRAAELSTRIGRVVERWSLPALRQAARDALSERRVAYQRRIVTAAVATTFMSQSEVLTLLYDHLDEDDGARELRRHVDDFIKLIDT
jgi:hypothetical protein